MKTTANYIQARLENLTELLKDGGYRHPELSAILDLLRTSSKRTYDKFNTKIEHLQGELEAGDAKEVLPKIVEIMIANAEDLLAELEKQKQNTTD